jgi:hypothetical protein
MNAFLNRDDLLLRGIEPDIADRLLRDSEHTGHGGQRVIPEADLADLLDMLIIEGRAQE